MAEKKAIQPEAIPTVRRARGSQPPKLNLAEAGEIITALYERAGSEASLDELSEILQNSRKSSSFVAKLNVLKKYGLVTFDADKIKLSETAEAIVAPEDQFEKAVALKDAFLQHEPFQIVYDKYTGRLLPEDGFLKNSFLEVGGRDLAELWMEQFKASAEYAGLLMDRGDGKFQVRELGKAQPKSAKAETISQSDATNGDDGDDSGKPPVKTQVQVKTDSQFLYEIMSPDMEPEEMEAVWTLLKFIKKKESQKFANDKGVSV